jgi:hypothetical protein
MKNIKNTKYEEYIEKTKNIKNLPIPHQNLIKKIIKLSLDDKYIILAKIYIHYFIVKDIVPIFEPEYSISVLRNYINFIGYNPIIKNDISVHENFELFSQKIKENVIIYKKLNNDFLFPKNKQKKQNKVTFLDLEE